MTDKAEAVNGGEPAALELEDYYRPSDFEIAACWVHGLLPPVSHPESSLSPREALEAAILPSLLSSTCFVGFSGGRDSSAVLAVATQLARREGLADPVPVTQRYPGIPEADETEYQVQVVEHLKLKDWVVVDMAIDQSDLLGADAREGLRRRGLIWPPTLQIKSTLLQQVAGGSLVGGEGGDEVLGIRRPRPIAALLASRQRPTVTGVRSAMAAAAPRAVRRWRKSARLENSSFQPWLRPEFRREHLRMVVADDVEEPLLFPGSLAWLHRRRGSALFAANHRRMAAEFSVTVNEPMLSRGFIGAVARSGGRWGYSTRTEAMWAMFGDCLPRPVIERRKKSSFNRAFIGSQSRQFVKEWDGSGVDHGVVDADRLRQEWLSEMPSAMSMTLLHQAWLASQPTAAAQAAR